MEAHQPGRKAANTLKPLKAGYTVATKKAPGTPNLNAQKADAARRNEPKPTPVTAERVRALGWAHPARQAYNKAAHLGGPAAQAAFQQAMSLLAP